MNVVVAPYGHFKSPRLMSDVGIRPDRQQLVPDVRVWQILLQKSRLRARCDFANVLKRSPAIG